MNLDKKAFIQRIQSNWEKSPTEFSNPKFIQYCQEFFEDNADKKRFSEKKKVIAGNFTYKEQIDLDDLYDKLYIEETFPLDSDDEIILFVQGSISWLGQGVYVITNKHLYYKAQSSKKLLDSGESVGRLHLSEIKRSAQVKGWANHELLIDGRLIGVIEIADLGKKSYAKLIEKFFTGIALNNESLITDTGSEKQLQTPSSNDGSKTQPKPIHKEHIPQEPEDLKPGESIDKGYCPKCGDVGVKTVGKGYNPGCGGLIFHLIMCLVTVGGWLPFWGGWMLACYLRKGTKSCMQCGQKLSA
jgi:hypothetical protein